MARVLVGLLLCSLFASDVIAGGGLLGGRGILRRCRDRVRNVGYTPPASLSNVRQFTPQTLCVDCVTPGQTTVYPGSTTVQPGATTTYQQPATVYSTPSTVVSTPSTVQRIVQAAPRIIERVVEQPRSTAVVESQPRVVERVIESPNTQVIQERVVEKSTTPAATQMVVECPPVDYDRIDAIVKRRIEESLSELRVEVKIMSGAGRVLLRESNTL